MVLYIVSDGDDAPPIADRDEKAIRTMHHFDSKQQGVIEKTSPVSHFAAAAIPLCSYTYTYLYGNALNSCTVLYVFRLLSDCHFEIGSATDYDRASLPFEAIANWHPTECIEINYLLYSSLPIF